MMRHSWVIFALSLALAGCAGYDRELMGEPEPEPAQVAPAEVAYQEPEDARVEPADSLAMFDDLKFYGSWYDLYPYGMVWRPTVVSTWAPMTYGHWVWTSYGWMWASYDPFGWAVYNYGFWTYDFALGWVWIPDYVWAPVQCEWIGWDDWVGWCPLPPPGIHYDDPWKYRDDGPWVTVPVTKFKETDVVRYRQAPKFKAGTSERTLRRQAPEAGVIERGLGHPLKVVDVQVDRTLVGRHELTRVVLPHEEQAIVEQERAKPRMKSPPPTQPGSGGSEGSGKTKEEVSPPPKEKSSSSPPAKKESPPKFKEKEKAKEPDKSKDGGKSKG
jgi:hypothetical protein